MSGTQVISPTEASVRRGISGSTVKIVAVLTMLIDHTAAVVLTRQIFASGYIEAIIGGQNSFQNWIAQNNSLYYANTIMRSIGRLGFPIFCFLLVEGFQRSRDVRKYALRLGVFALISEIPFDLAITGKWWHLGYQNVYFTLFLGLLALCGYGLLVKYENKEGGKDLPGALRMALTLTGGLSPAFLVVWQMAIPFGRSTYSVLAMTAAGAAVGGVTAAVLAIYGRKRGFRRVQTACASMTVLVVLMFVAELLHTDYSAMGVLTITVMYLYRKHRVASMAAGCFILTLMSLGEISAFAALIFIALYDGRRGLKMKYFFYVFYPLHLLLLYLISVWMGLGGMVLL